MDARRTQGEDQAMTPPHPSLLAEAVSIDGGTLVLILVLFFAFVGVTVGLAVLGCVWAYRAGKGSASSRTGLICIGVLEGFALASIGLSLLRGGFSPFSVAVVVLVAAQIGLYALGRANRPPSPLPAAQPGVPRWG